MISAMEFQMETHETGPGQVRVVLFGELDLASGPRVQGELERLREAGLAVTIDLADLDFMDSAGLVAIAELTARWSSSAGCARPWSGCSRSLGPTTSSGRPMPPTLADAAGAPAA
jgi:anti-anti-sigma factor